MNNTIIISLSIFNKIFPGLFNIYQCRLFRSQKKAKQIPTQAIVK
jgi:hypothetical protein